MTTEMQCVEIREWIAELERDAFIFDSGVNHCRGMEGAARRRQRAQLLRDLLSVFERELSAPADRKEPRRP